MKKLLFMGVAAALLFTACKPDSFDLKLRLIKGKKYSYDVNTTVEVNSADPRGDKHLMSQDMHYVYDMTVENTDSKGNMTVSCIYSQIGMRAKQDGETRMDFDTKTYDSTQEAGPDVQAMSAMFSSLIGQKFTLELSPQGKITAVKGIDEIVNHVVKMMQVPADQSEEVKKSVKINLINEELLTSYVKHTFNIYPEQPVKTGDSWDLDYNYNTQMMNMHLKNTYTLKDVQGDKLKLDISSLSNTVKDSMNFMGFEYNLNGTQNGTLSLDKNTGMVTEASFTQNLTGNLEAGRMKTPMDLRSTTAVKVTEK